QRLSVPGYTFAAKTGTAQKVDPVTRHYSTEKWVASFVGFAPAEEPRLVLFVMIDEPRGNHHGSIVAGPVFTEGMADGLRWMGVPPIGSSVAEPPAVAASASTSTATSTGTATSTSTSTEVEEEVEAEAAVDEAGEVRQTARAEVPDFTGMSMGEALEAA